MCRGPFAYGHATATRILCGLSVTPRLQPLCVRIVWRRQVWSTVLSRGDGRLVHAWEERYGRLEPLGRAGTTVRDLAPVDRRALADRAQDPRGRLRDVR